MEFGCSLCYSHIAAGVQSGKPLTSAEVTVSQDSATPGFGPDPDISTESGSIALSSIFSHFSSQTAKQLLSVPHLNCGGFIRL